MSKDHDQPKQNTVSENLKICGIFKPRRVFFLSSQNTSLNLMFLITQLIVQSLIFFKEIMIEKILPKVVEMVVQNLHEFAYAIPSS